MHIGITMFATDYAIAPHELAKEAEDRGFESLWLPEHTHIPASRKTPYPAGVPLPQEYWHTYDPFGALCAAAAYEGDVLIVESENDKIVPREVIVNYRNACKKARSLTCRTIAGADHALTDPARREAYTKLLVDWISKMVAQEVTDDAAAQKRLREAMKTQTAIRMA